MGWRWDVRGGQIAERGGAAFFFRAVGFRNASRKRRDKRPVANGSIGVGKWIIAVPARRGGKHPSVPARAGGSGRRGGRARARAAGRARARRSRARARFARGPRRGVATRRVARTADRFAAIVGISLDPGSRWPRGSVFACHRFARVRGARAARSRAGGGRVLAARGAARALRVLARSRARARSRRPGRGRGRRRAMDSRLRAFVPGGWRGRRPPSWAPPRRRGTP